jgi:mRNA interferase MazF
MASIKEVKQFDVYWATFDPAVGSEIQKTRPCIIVSPDIMNNLLNTVLVIPLTKTFIDWPFRISMWINGKQSSAACDHLRAISKERLGKKVMVLEPGVQDKVLDTLQNIFVR